MQTETIAGVEMHFDDEGFLVDPNTWSEAVATELASQLGIAMTEDHWAAVKFAREDWTETGVSPTVRRVSTMAGIPTKQLYELFPKKPAKKLAIIAGVPKPVGCI